MEIIKQYIVEYKQSENPDKLAILFNTKCGKWFIKYCVWDFEDALEEIAESEAQKLII